MTGTFCFFTCDSRDTSQSVYFFTVHRHEQIQTKNQWKWAVENNNLITKQKMKIEMFAGQTLYLVNVAEYKICIAGAKYRRQWGSGSQATWLGRGSRPSTPHMASA